MRRLCPRTPVCDVSGLNIKPGDDSLVAGRRHCAARTSLQHSRLLLRLLDQLLADHHVAAGNEEDHGRCAGEGQNEMAALSAAGVTNWPPR